VAFSNEPVIFGRWQPAVNRQFSPSVRLAALPTGIHRSTIVAPLRKRWFIGIICRWILVVIHTIHDHGARCRRLVIRRDFGEIRTAWNRPDCLVIFRRSASSFTIFSIANLCHPASACSSPATQMMQLIRLVSSCG